MAQAEAENRHDFDVDLNSAREDELARLPIIGRERAAASQPCATAAPGSVLRANRRRREKPHPRSATSPTGMAWTPIPRRAEKR